MVQRADRQARGRARPIEREHGSRRAILVRYSRTANDGTGRDARRDAVAPTAIGYLCITGHHRSFVRFPYLAPQFRQEGFVPRVILPAPIAPAWRAQVIPLRPVAASRPRKRI